MSEQDHLSAEEREAMTAMEADTAPVTEEEQQQVTEEAGLPEPEPEQEPEFKSSRPAPIDWNKLSPDQQEAVSRFVNEGKPPQGFVPHQSMHAERMRRQELEREFAEFKAKFEKPADEPPQWVDPIEDPEGNRKWAEYMSQKARDDAIAEFRQQSEAQQQRMDRVNKAASAEQEFAAKQADYPQATEYLKNARAQQLFSQGYGEQEVMQQLSREANAVFDAAQAAGLNPAQIIYLKAQEMGYKAAPAPAQSEAERITHLANVQQQTRGPGSVGGSAQQGALTMQQLASMSEAELAKVPDDVKRKAMGG